MINSPSNPAGSVYARDEIKALADLVKDHDLILVSDEIYEKILYEGEHVSPASLDGMFDRTVTVHGFSKTYSMTGWRLGWLVAPSPLFKEISKVQEHTITCATAFPEGRRRGPPRADHAPPGNGQGVPRPARPGPQGTRDDRGPLDAPADGRLQRLPAVRCGDRQRDPERTDPEGGVGRGDPGKRVRGSR